MRTASNPNPSVDETAGTCVQVQHETNLTLEE